MEWYYSGNARLGHMRKARASFDSIPYRTLQYLGQQRYPGYSCSNANCGH
jgi:hypothetical protein